MVGKMGLIRQTISHMPISCCFSSSFDLDRMISKQPFAREVFDSVGPSIFCHSEKAIGNSLGIVKGRQRRLLLLEIFSFVKLGFLSFCSSSWLCVCFFLLRFLFSFCQRATTMTTLPRG